VSDAFVRRAQVGAALLMATATVAGAFGAHALRGRLDPGDFELLHTAVQYQFIHALGLLVIGALAERRAQRGLRLAADLLLAGVLLFSGSLYLLLGGAPRVIGVLTPIGGACLIAGWCVAACALLRRPRATEP
jgi:uncharacterized membrane protein YgdD (TMEM256/DUF423 family)